MSEKRIAFPLRIPARIMERVRDRAAAEMRSINSEICSLVTIALSVRDKDYSKILQTWIVRQ